MTHDCLSNRKNNKQMFLNMVYVLPSLQWLLPTVYAYSDPACATFLAVGMLIPLPASVWVVRCSVDDSDIFTFLKLLNSKSPMWPCIGIHKNEVWANGTSEQTHMGKKYLITIAIPGYRPSVENVELSSPVQHNTSPDRNSRTTVTVSFLGVTGIKPGPDLSSNQNALRITYGTEPTLIHEEDTTPLVDISVIPCCCSPRVATTNLSNSCTCGLERLPSARNDTFVDSQLCSYTGDSTPLLHLSDHSSTCEVVQRPGLKKDFDFDQSLEREQKPSVEETRRHFSETSFNLCRG
ncbi:uncharacterized protein TNCV_1951011 [Trichonephila clavipes]|nr:uncharacterized protein TNCV_1951011 [Trichonephila clavipes]